jgi:hypothetical protein
LNQFIKNINSRLVEVNDGNVHDFELELFEVTDKTPPSFNEPIKGNTSC